MVVGVVVLACSTTLFADTREVRPQQKPESEAQVGPQAPFRSAAEGTVESPPVEIAKIRLDPPPPGETENAAVLRFRMSNGSASTLADIVFEVSIVEDRRGRLDTPRRTLAGPFAIRGTTVLDPGYTAEYEILLRNISTPCQCRANVRVLSFRSIEESGSQFSDRRRQHPFEVSPLHFASYV